MKARGPAKSPTATVTRPKRSTAPHVDTADALRLEVVIDQWRLAFLLDSHLTTGELRSLAETIAGVTGCNPALALHAVLTAIVPEGAGDWEAAA